ncbi:calcium-binding protein [Propionivibrio sp.]|nr:calcium-binding protein [Propionivibrio sp.]
MAAEALYSFDTRKKDPNLLPPGDLLSSVGHDSGVIDPAVLTSGNEHASRFTATEAAAFVAQWEVVDHLSNTTTGFSGTLFKNKSNTNELVLSIRSTEFIDDVVRDCVATNAMELKAFGWAFGQINDMEAWYANLSKPGGPLAGKHFSVTEAASAGTDLVQSSVTYSLAANVENLTLTGTNAINGTGNALDNILIGNSAVNTLTGGAGNDTLDGGAGADKLLGGLGDDTYIVDNTGDVVTENANEGTDLIQSSVTYTLSANVEALVLTGTGAINGTGNTGNNLVRGNGAVNTLNGGTGNDILEGGDGNDILSDTSGTALFNGGTGADTITGGAGAEIYLGGLGNDTYTTGAGNDIILFNKGDGQDTLATGGTGSDTVSLGGGVVYTDLSFSKMTNDLVLKVGASDQITFKDWYAATPSKPVVNLQMIAEAMADFAPGGADPWRDQKVENFNFAGLVGAFDAARAANPTLTSWALTNALATFQLAGSDSAAIGGDLAYQYGKNGTLAGIGVTPAFTVLNNAGLGTSAQTLNPLASLQVGAQRLS